MHDVMTVNLTKTGMKVVKYTQYGIKKYRRNPQLGKDIWPGAAVKIQKWGMPVVRETNITVRYCSTRPRRPGWYQIDQDDSSQAKAIFRQIDLVYIFRRDKKRYHRPFIELMMALNGVEVV